eukprot:TRINITY_DN17187_c0_g1_i1.p1 TRINITY_DN17187_c0_g1~~TRINITY_DN17187_c0_g1_i1.p1  ORF type:complete len:469 (+),score=79.21 TRINITY_DN17187_c0_g1_i1:101-1507(+)
MASDDKDGVRQRLKTTEADASPPSSPPASGESPSAKKLVDEHDYLSPENGWRPYPWNYFPDFVPFVLGALQIAFVGPFVIFLIAAAESSWYVLMKVWQHPKNSYFRHKIPSLIMSLYAEPSARIMLKDPRNASFIPWITLGACLPPFIFLCAAHRHQAFGLELTTLFIYHFVRIGPRFRFFAHIHTLFHKEGHAHGGLFKDSFSMFNGLCEWWIGPFYGLIPGSYRVAHTKIHHRWHNDVDDIHTNLDLDRTDPLQFVKWIPRFSIYWTGIGPLALFMKRGEWGYVKELGSGILTYYAVTVLLLLWNPTFAICYWIYPHVEGMLGLGVIAYLWHSFVDEDDPGNIYVNSLTILDGHDNVWNEDYHVVHHHFPGVHWTDVPDQYWKDIDKYKACTATIFRDTEQGMLIKWLLGQEWDEMAKHFVDLNDKLTHDEKRELLIKRLKVRVGGRGRDGKRTDWASDSTIRNWG